MYTHILGVVGPRAHDAQRVGGQTCLACLIVALHAHGAISCRVACIARRQTAVHKLQPVAGEYTPVRLPFLLLEARHLNSGGTKARQWRHEHAERSRSGFVHIRELEWLCLKRCEIRVLEDRLHPAALVEDGLGRRQIWSAQFQFETLCIECRV